FILAKKTGGVFSTLLFFFCGETIMSTLEILMWVAGASLAMYLAFKLADWLVVMKRAKPHWTNPITTIDVIAPIKSWKEYPRGYRAQVIIQLSDPHGLIVGIHKPDFVVITNDNCYDCEISFDDDRGVTFWIEYKSSVADLYRLLKKCGDMYTLFGKY